MVTVMIFAFAASPVNMMRMDVFVVSDPRFQFSVEVIHLSSTSWLIVLLTHRAWTEPGKSKAKEKTRRRSHSAGWRGMSLVAFMYSKSCFNLELHRYRTMFFECQLINNFVDRSRTERQHPKIFSARQFIPTLARHFISSSCGTRARRPLPQMPLPY